MLYSVSNTHMRIIHYREMIVIWGGDVRERKPTNVVRLWADTSSNIPTTMT